MDDGDREGELRFRGGVLALVASQLQSEWFPPGLGVGLVGGVGAVVQLEGLADGAKRVLNRAKADLMSPACVPCTDVSGEGPEDVNVALRSGDI